MPHLTSTRAASQGRLDQPSRGICVVPINLHDLSTLIHPHRLEARVVGYVERLTRLLVVPNVMIRRSGEDGRQAGERVRAKHAGRPCACAQRRCSVRCLAQRRCSVRCLAQRRCSVHCLAQRRCSVRCLTRARLRMLPRPARGLTARGDRYGCYIRYIRYIRYSRYSRYIRDSLRTLVDSRREDT